MPLKKLEFLVPDLLTPYINDNFPLYVQFITILCKYLDENSFGKIHHIDDNLNSYDTYEEFLDLFLNEIFTQSFDFDVYGLTNENKKRFIDLAEKINGLKGNKQGFAVFFQTLTNFRVATSTGIIGVSNLGTISFSESILPEEILQYFFSIQTSDVESYYDLIDNVHPAGMLYNITGVLYNGLYKHNESIDYSGNVINELFDGDLYYDGTIDYEGNL